MTEMLNCRTTVDIFIERDGVPLFFTHLAPAANKGVIGLFGRSELPKGTKLGDRVTLRSAEMEELVLTLSIGIPEEGFVILSAVRDNYQDYVQLIRTLLTKYGFEPPPWLDDEDYFWENDFETPIEYVDRVEDWPYLLSDLVESEAKEFIQANDLKKLGEWLDPQKQQIAFQNDNFAISFHHRKLDGLTNCFIYVVDRTRPGGFQRLDELYSLRPKGLALADLVALRGQVGARPAVTKIFEEKLLRQYVRDSVTWLTSNAQDVLHGDFSVLAKIAELHEALKMPPPG